jgi:hypothetical protein
MLTIETLHHGNYTNKVYQIYQWLIDIYNKKN